MLVVPLHESKAYVLEVASLLGYDGRFCDSGVLIYTVDTAVHSGQGPIRLVPANGDSSHPTCGLLFNAPFDLAPGEISSFDDGQGFSVRLVSREPDGSYRIRVKKD